MTTITEAAGHLARYQESANACGMNAVRLRADSTDRFNRPIPGVAEQAAGWQAAFDTSVMHLARVQQHFAVVASQHLPANDAFFCPDR